VNQYDVGHELITTFLNSMEMDLDQSVHNDASYQAYILGSAEVVGLMCLHVFTEGDKELFTTLKEPAMRLGSAFQKVNFLRDLQDDHGTLGRTYFPGVNVQELDETTKTHLVNDIAKDMADALVGIRKLPKGARCGVHLAYVYYNALLEKIKRVPPERILTERVRIPNARKFGMLMRSRVKHSFGL